MKRILIVDDDGELRTNLSEILGGAGYYTDEAASGKEAVAKAVSGNFDVAVLDFMMPGMSGMDVLTEFRKLAPKIKIIMITAFATIENAVAAIKKGADDYISKPFRIGELLVTVKRVLEESRFESGMKRLDTEQALSSLANPIRRNIIRLLHIRPGARLMEITRELDIEDHTKVIFHLKMLKEADIIEQDKEKSYRLTKEGERIIGLLKVLENYLSAV